jgi:hypothetical protein
MTKDQASNRWNSGENYLCRANLLFIEDKDVCFDSDTT